MQTTPYGIGEWRRSVVAVQASSPAQTRSFLVGIGITRDFSLEVDRGQSDYAKPFKYSQKHRKLRESNSHFAHPSGS
jgi:hypothetical protein